MYGSLSGNVFAVIYFLSFQICGIIIADYLFNKESRVLRVLIGSVCGSFLLMWLPVITSMIAGFNIISHILALLLLVAVMLTVVMLVSKKSNVTLLLSKSNVTEKSILTICKENIVFIILFVILSVFYFLLLNNHVLVIKDDGVYCGQCTYGDMNMHLGFITSIAKQGTFPPDYSIMPGEKLCYPFLCDSISSSLYIFGCSLKLAYCLPMAVAFMQVLGGFYVFANAWLKDRAKSVLSFVLFFLNGGFGFLYFINVLGDGGHTIGEIFTEFYHTPTNFVQYNVKWVNVIADMLLPQRATLFGWAILFTVLYLLWRAHFESKREYFYFAGVLAGGLVMIHTHSFLALGIVCAVWLMFYMIKLADINFDFDKQKSVYIRSILLALSILIMSLLRVYDLKNSMNPDITTLWFVIGIAGILAYIIFIVIIGYKLYKKSVLTNVFYSWGVFLAVVLPLALIQLFTWTFNQATGDNFVRGQFNWANIDDQYIVFYLKNIGLIMLFIILALIFSKKKDFRLAMSGIGIWFIAEFLGFQPNEYDNNKLLYIGFIFLLIPAASIMVDIFKKIKYRVVAVLIAIPVMFCCTISGILTLGREYVSEYQLYGKNYVSVADYINESDIPADSVILTNSNHNNVISSITGRNIVVGTSTFLYYHGFDTTERANHVRLMFEDPGSNNYWYEHYGVEYVYIGDYEKANYNIDYEWFNSNCKLLYESENTWLLQIIK